MLYEARYIDKNRVISNLGKTSSQFFNKIYNKLFEQIFEPIHYKIHKLEKKSTIYRYCQNNINNI